ncbi:MAG: cadherin-like beta sandwich domain-containing protein, partial [Planctomycetota bacterium]
MDDLAGATMGSVAQRNDNPGMIGFNDAGWEIHPGNYDRFIYQINPDTTSKGLWRVNGTLTTSSHPYDRFARRSDHVSGNDTMYFNINDKLLRSPGQRVQLNVTYLDRGTGQFAVQYDAIGNSQKTAFTVTKTGSNTWMTQSIVVTDWRFENNGPNGSDMQLVNVATDAANPDTIYHGIEVIKLANVSVGIVGLGTVSGRNNTATFSAIPSSVMESQRLELKATPAPGWRFTGWSGALSGTNPNPFLFPTQNTQLTATFASLQGGPVANSQTANIAFNTETSITLSGTDPNIPALTPLTYAVTTNPAHGTLNGTAPNLTYTPTNGYSGSDSFQFTVTNTANVTSNAVTVSLTIAPSSNNDLLSLVPSVGNLSPEFVANQLTYALSVTSTTASITLTPTAVVDSGATVTVNGASVVSGTASGAMSLIVGDTVLSVVVKAADGTLKTYTITVTRPALPVFTSLPTALPNPATVTQSVQLTATATHLQGVTYSWDFGDGTSGSGAVVDHTYALKGTYTVAVTATSGINTSASATLTLSVNPMIGGNPGSGSGTLVGEMDSDGDGYSDNVELATGTNPNSTASAPGEKTVAPAAIAIVKPVMKVVKTRSALTLTGSLLIPAGFNPTGKILVVDVGGY